MYIIIILYNRFSDTIISFYIIIIIIRNNTTHILLLNVRIDHLSINLASKEYNIEDHKNQLHNNYDNDKRVHVAIVTNET